MRPSLRIKRILLGTTLTAAAAVGAGVVYQLIESRRDRRRFPQSGRLVKVGRHALHIHESGSGAPSVVLEAGIGSSSLSWATVQPEIAGFARVCSYDRAGLGWSEMAKGPRSLERLVEELRSALQAIDFPYPRILVGHSFGGLIVRAYAARHPEGIAGIVLVDPVLPSDWIDATQKQLRLLALGARLSRRGAWLARLGIVRFALWLLASGSRRVPQWISRVSSGQGSGVIQRLVGEIQKLPPDLWPVVQAHWSSPKCFQGMAGYLEALPASAAEIAAIEPPPHIPLTVLSAATASRAQRQEWDRIAARHITAHESGHWIQFDQPQLVVNAVRDLVNEERSVDSGLL